MIFSRSSFIIYKKRSSYSLKIWWSRFVQNMILKWCISFQSISVKLVLNIVAFASLTYQHGHVVRSQTVLLRRGELAPLPRHRDHSVYKYLFGAGADAASGRWWQTDRRAVGAPISVRQGRDGGKKLVFPKLIFSSYIELNLFDILCKIKKKKHS